MLTLLLLACPPNKEDTSPSPDDSVKESIADTTPPSAPVVEISPDPASPDNDLSVTITTPSEPGRAGDEVTYRYAWMRNGSPTSETSDTISAELTENGDTWQVSVTPEANGMVGGEGTDTILIGNPEPSVPVIHIDPASPDPGNDLTLIVDSAAIDPLGEALTESITWKEDGEDRPDLTGMMTIAGTEVDGGETWSVVYSVSDGVNPAVEAVASVTASNQAPEISRVTISPMDANDNSMLACTARSSDPDQDLTTTTYHWYRDGIEIIELLDETTVDPSYTTPNEEWYCSATVSDGHAEVTASSDTVVILDVTKVWYYHDWNMTLTPDETGEWASMTGTYELYLKTSGVYGNIECEVLWDMEGSPGTCRNCDYSFSVDATVDLAASTLTNGCSNLAIDSTAEIESMRGSGSFGMIDAYFIVGTPYYGYESVNPEGYFGDNYAAYYNYYGYITNKSFYYTSSVDSYGNLQISAYAHLYISQP